MPRLRSLLFALAVVLTSVAAVAAEDPNTAVRQAFMDAMAAVPALPNQAAPGDPQALQDYVLYPYLQAARLLRQLELVTPAATQLQEPLLPIDGDVADFLARHGDRPVTRTLRQKWLTSLADRRAWQAFDGEFRADRDSLVTLQCHALTARIALGRTKELVDDLTSIWLVPKSLPEACDPAVDWWKSRGGPGDSLTERRARLALGAGEAGLARFLARSLPEKTAAPLLQWAALIEQPAKEIMALLADPDRPVEDDALQDGWLRYARADAEAAAATYARLVESRKMDARTASPYALAVGLALSWSRIPGALEFFKRVHPDDFDERAFEWHARAALWAGDWRAAAAVIGSMPDSLKSLPRWQYWAARADEQLGDFAKARSGYAAVIPTDNWYAVLASARLDRKFSPTLQALLLNDAEVDQLASEPGFTRSHELLACNMAPEASAEWRAAYDELPPARQASAVGLASRWGWHEQVIATAARQKLFNDYDLLYPRPYDFYVQEAGKRTGLSPHFIYAIIRQESLYRADAGSAAGALGLMQLLPETARLTARRAGLPAPTRAQLLVPSVNIPLGSAYLASLVERFEGETALASAAYNAGPNAARRWLPEMPLELDVWAENIPFNETRAYVQRVAWHSLVFAWLDHREPRNVSGWLRSVRPAEPEAAGAR